VAKVRLMPFLQKAAAAAMCAMQTIRMINENASVSYFHKFRGCGQNLLLMYCMLLLVTPQHLALLHAVWCCSCQGAISTIAALQDSIKHPR
jgi:hypothetical protein